jgi:hypothetical protein
LPKHHKVIITLVPVPFPLSFNISISNYSEATDYSFSSPADYWPSSFEDDAVMSSVPNTFVASAAEKKLKRLRPIRTMRKIAGWVFGSPPGRNTRGFGTQNFL